MPQYGELGFVVAVVFEVLREGLELGVFEELAEGVVRSVVGSEVLAVGLAESGDEGGVVLVVDLSAVLACPVVEI